MTTVKVTVIITSGGVADTDTVTLDYPMGALLTDVTEDMVRRLKGEEKKE